MIIKHRLRITPLLAGLAALTLWGLASGAGGCGGGSAAKPDQAGLTIFSVTSIPSFRKFLNPSVLVQNGPTPILKLQSAPGTFCSEFCYLKQGLLEAQRELTIIDYSVCLAKAIQTVNSDFDLPTSGCRYFNLLSESGEIPVRLCHNGDQVGLTTCSGGSVDGDYAFTNDPASGSVAGVLTRSFSNDSGCDDKSKVDFSANCPPEEFRNGDCHVAINGNFCGCYGSGQVQYGVTGGSTPQLDASSHFTAGGMGTTTSGDINLCSIGNWSLGGRGCFKSDADGSYPAIPVSQVPLTELGGCDGLANATDLCPNDRFDPANIDPAYPICPFEAAIGGSCAVLFANADCCDVTGDSLDATSAVTADRSSVSSILDQVSAASCTDTVACDAVAFVDAWDCKPSTGATFVTIDLMSSTADFSACQTLLDEVNNFTVESPCDKQAAEEEICSTTGISSSSAFCQ